MYNQHNHMATKLLGNSIYPYPFQLGGGFQLYDIETQDKIRKTGDVTCGDVTGNVTATSGDVKCGSVGGSIRTTSGDVRYR
jgi:hypothetical protein